jgi:hypothetical protein
MKFIQDHLEAIIYHLDQIDGDTQPLWGRMTAQKMIEHLTESVWTSSGKISMECPYSGEKLERSRAFLMSEAPMPKEFKAHFVDDSKPVRNESFELAVDEFIESWVDFEEHCELNPNFEYVHPVFGILNMTEWRWMHRKHITHHFTQFGVTIVDLELDKE